MKSTKDNNELVPSTMAAIWYQENLAFFDERFASDFVGHEPDKMEESESVKPIVAAMRNATPVIQFEDQIV